jgi:hypothetical protein
MTQSGNNFEELVPLDILNDACRDCGALGEICRSSLKRAFDQLLSCGETPTLTKFGEYFHGRLEIPPCNEEDAAWGQVAMDLIYGSSYISLEHWKALVGTPEFNPNWVVLTLWNAPWFWVEDDIREVGRSVRELAIQQDIQATLVMIEESGRDYCVEWVGLLKSFI